MQFKFRKLSHKGLVAITAMLLTILLGAQHVGQNQHRSTDQPDTLAMIAANGSEGRKDKSRASKTADTPSAPYASHMLPNALPVERLSGVIKQNETWEAGAVHVIDDTVVIPDGVTVTIEAGAIVKYHTQASVIHIAGGTLMATGQARNPVIFTQYADDSHGGDSNGNGFEAVPIAMHGAGGAIRTTGGVISVQYGQFVGLGYPIAAEAAERIDIRNSIFTAVQSVTIAGTKQPLLLNNTFDFQNTNGLGIVLRDIADISQISLSGDTMNKLSGAPYVSTVHLSDVAIPSTATWRADAASGAALRIGGNVRVYGAMAIGRDAMVMLGAPTYASEYALAVYGRLTVEAGVHVQAAHTQGILAEDGGVVAIEGTHDDVVQFMCSNDGSLALTAQPQATIRIHSAAFYGVDAIVKSSSPNSQGVQGIEIIDTTLNGAAADNSAAE